MLSLVNLFKYLFIGAPVDQLVKRWTTDLAVSGCGAPQDPKLVQRKRGSISHSLSLSPCHHHEMTENTVEKEVKLQVIHPS